MRHEWLLLWGLAVGVSALVFALMAPEACKNYSGCWNSGNNYIIFQGIATSCPTENPNHFTCTWHMTDECPIVVNGCSDTYAMICRVATYACAGLSTLILLIGFAVKLQKESLQRSEEIDVA